MLGSTNLGPSVFLVFYCNFVKRGPFATKMCTHSGHFLLISRFFLLIIPFSSQFTLAYSSLTPFLYRSRSSKQAGV